MPIDERSDAQRLGDMRVLGARVVEHRAQVDFSGKEGCSARDALLYNLALVGTAASGLSGAARARFSRIPWNEVIALRDLHGKPDRLLDLDLVQHRAPES